MSAIKAKFKVYDGSDWVEYDFGGDAEGIKEISTQYIRITSLNPGIYKLTYAGNKYIYYNGSTSTTIVNVYNTTAILIVAKYSTTRWHWTCYAGNSSAKGNRTFYGDTSTTSGTYTTFNPYNILKPDEDDREYLDQSLALGGILAVYADSHSWSEIEPPDNFEGLDADAFYFSRGIAVRINMDDDEEICQYAFPWASGTLALTSDISWDNIIVNDDLELVPNLHSSLSDWQTNGKIKSRAYKHIIRLQDSYKKEEYPSGYYGQYDNKIELSPGYYGPQIKFTDCRDKPGNADLMANGFSFYGHSGYNSRCGFTVNGSNACTYAHHVHIWNNSSTRYSISFILFTESKEPITSFADLRNYIYYGKANGNTSAYHNTINRSVSAHGFYNSYTNIVTGIYAGASGSGNITLRYQSYNGSETSVSLSSFANLQDSVDQILGGWW